MEPYLIMPMAGAGARFSADGCALPKPLLPLHGKPFFYWAAMSVVGTVPLAGLRFAVLREHVDFFGIDREIRRFFPTAELVVLEHVLRGAVLTCREAVRGLPDDAPVLFNDCDHLFRCPALTAMLAQDARPDGALLTFRSSDPCYSYAALDARECVIRTAEKEVIGDRAICGAYYFDRKGDFDRFSEQYLQTCRYAEFFMSGVYNTMIDGGKTVRTLPTALHLSFGTPAEYAAAQHHPIFEEWK